MNEENEWDHRIEATVKEGPADCIRISEVATALKQMKRHKAQACQGSGRDHTIHSGYQNSVDAGFM